MTRFNVLFSKKKDGFSASTAGATGSSPRYDPHLLLQLKQEHAALRKLYGQLCEAHATEDLPSLRSLLREFKMALNIHLLEENVKFYTYLQHKIPSGASDLDTVTSFWKEMQDIGKTVLDFVRRYDGDEFDVTTMVAFGRELEEVGPLLMTRLQREEDNLFGLYLPSQ